MVLYQHLPPDAVKIVLVLFLSFLVGLEREEHKNTPGVYTFGGVRTFPLLGLIGYSLALIAGPNLVSFTIGFLAVSGFLLLSFWHKLTTSDAAGVTTEMSGVATFLAGALVSYDHYWIATAIIVASLLLLDLKAALEQLATRIAPGEIFTFTKFLLLTGVIMPVFPNQEFGPFHINPFKTWLVVVAISAISYASYVLQKLSKGQGGIVLSALLGGAYSSTVVTVVLARQSKVQDRPHLFAGSILMASGVMYLRIALLLALFNHQLMALLLWPSVVLACVAVGAGWLWTRRADRNAPKVESRSGPGNPLELSAALLFALLFLLTIVVTQLALTYLGQTGVNTLAAIMGITVVDPFIMGMTQAACASTPVNLAAGAILIAAASNNLAKGIYAFSLAGKRTGMQSLVFLIALTAAGLVPLYWLAR